MPGKAGNDGRAGNPHAKMDEEDTEGWKGLVEVLDLFL